MIDRIIRFFEKPYLAVLYSLFILALCSMPSENLPGEDINDKLAHFVAFAGISFLWMWVSQGYLKVIVLSALFGLIIEFIQGALPASFHRSYDLMDALADGVGVLIGVGLYYIAFKLLGIKKES
ncbi:VanZ family protein [Arcticibacterium luteifluviistationis]|uniref:VanZ-like domain-containing protein n=1 Tax=Arcticibacterium luteifluviistationis TaxID=1784714 RepID=A0A2Z4GI90_9BACT|nr:VanZ family protein [Arcticibacterium luteifluviistationis]AWW00676.1 hypothetical protein DJ013_21805 [Arcticibacterium luteifluviistationis]